MTSNFIGKLLLASMGISNKPEKKNNYVKESNFREHGRRNTLTYDVGNSYMLNVWPVAVVFGN